MAATVPVNVRVGYEVSVNVVFCPGCTLPMSASLIAALICGVVTSMRVTNELLEVLEVLVLLVDTELVAPPLIHWPTTPFRLATVPLVGATSVAAWRLAWAVWRAAWELAT